MPVEASPTNTVLEQVRLGCVWEFMYGNFGATPYATARRTYSGSTKDCRVTSTTVYWASPASESHGGDWNGPPDVSTWYQKNGPNGKTAYGMNSCVESYSTYSGLYSYSLFVTNIYDGDLDGTWVDYGDSECHFIY